MKTPTKFLFFALIVIMVGCEASTTPLPGQSGGEGETPLHCGQHWTRELLDLTEIPEGFLHSPQQALDLYADRVTGDWIDRKDWHGGGWEAYDDSYDRSISIDAVGLALSHAGGPVTASWYEAPDGSPSCENAYVIPMLLELDVSDLLDETIATELRVRATGGYQSSLTAIIELSEVRGSARPDYNMPDFDILYQTYPDMSAAEHDDNTSLIIQLSSGRSEQAGALHHTGHVYWGGYGLTFQGLGEFSLEAITAPPALPSSGPSR